MTARVAIFSRGEGQRPFVWMGLLIALVLVGLVALLTWKLGGEFLRYRSEIEGVRQVQALYQLLTQLQAQRGLSTLALDNIPGGQAELKMGQAAVGEGMTQVEKILPQTLIDGEQWQSIRSEWATVVEEGAEWVITERFRRQSAVVETLIDLMVEVADESALTLDIHLDTYYLQDMLVIRLPRLQDQLARLRGLGAMALSRAVISDEMRTEIRLGLTELEVRLRQQKEGVERLRVSLPDRAARIDVSQDQLQLGVDAVIATLNHDVLQARFSSDAQRYYDTVSDHIAILDNLAEEVYFRELQRRLQRYIDVTLIQGGMVAFALVLAVITLVYLVRQVIRHANQLADTNRVLAEENQLRREKEEALQIAIAEAVQANQAKTQFLANLSHEVRTPLNGILGTAEVMNMLSPTAEQAALLDEMLNSSRSLRDLLDRIIDFTHIEAGEVTMAEVPFALADLFELLRLRFGPVAAGKGLDLHTSIDAALPSLALGDPRRLQQALCCLVDNAVRFTEHGGVTLRASRFDAGMPMMRIMVSDTGPGIRPEVRSFVFDSFTQGDGSFTRRQGGVGLGLAIARRLAQLMGGSLRLSEPVGEMLGSEFVLDIPLRAFNAE